MILLTFTFIIEQMRRWGKLFELSRSTGIWKVRIKKTVKDFY